MTIDFRASQIQTNRLIATGSTGTHAKFIIYPFTADGTPANQGNINPAVFSTSSIGTDVFFYISGTLQTNKVSPLPSTGQHTVFGGDAMVSGTMGFATWSPGSKTNLYIADNTIFTTGSESEEANIYVRAGSNAGTHDGGTLGFYGGVGYTGGTISLYGGDAILANTLGTSGGFIGLTSGQGSPGTSAATLGGTGGSIIITAASGGAGSKARAGDGGPITLTAGNGGIGVSGGGVGGNGGNISVIGGTAPAGSTVSGYPGNLIITAGSSSYGGGVVSLGDNEHGVTKYVVVGGRQSTTASLGTDTYLFISGAVGSVGTSVRGTTVFGGDIYVSGVLKTAGGLLARVPVGSYTTTTNTSASAQVCGHNFWTPSEVGWVPGSQIIFRAILSTTTASNTAYVKLWNITSLVFVEIGGPGITTLSTTSTTPFKLGSVNLGASGVVGFSTASNAIYEVQIYTSGAGITAILGSAELLNN